MGEPEPEVAMDAVVKMVQRVGPYLLLIVMPGGSVMALVLYVYRRYRGASL